MGGSRRVEAIGQCLYLKLSVDPGAAIKLMEKQLYVIGSLTLGISPLYITLMYTGHLIVAGAGAW